MTAKDAVRINLEVANICMVQEQAWGNRYRVAYQMGGPGYERKMHYAQNHMRKWRRRYKRALEGDTRLINAVIRWL